MVDHDAALVSDMEPAANLGRAVQFYAVNAAHK